MRLELMLAGADGTSRNADLPARLVSAIVMVAIAGTALWLGGWWWTGFVALVAIGVLFEWQRIVSGFSGMSTLAVIIWRLAGVIYIGFAANTLAVLRTFTEPGMADGGLFYVGLLVGSVIGVDVGAYFFGRAIGGPKIAPKISPSKTWAGLLGGCIGASIVLAGSYMAAGYHWTAALQGAWIAGIAIAVCAQAGDFFESWMKRRAGMKDSGALIPGHGGLFDRVDGLMAVGFMLGLAHLAVRLVAA